MSDAFEIILSKNGNFKVAISFTCKLCGQNISEHCEKTRRDFFSCGHVYKRSNLQKHQYLYNLIIKWILFFSSPIASQAHIMEMSYT